MLCRTATSSRWSVCCASVNSSLDPTSAATTTSQHCTRYVVPSPSCAALTCAQKNLLNIDMVAEAALRKATTTAALSAATPTPSVADPAPPALSAPPATDATYVDRAAARREAHDEPEQPSVDPRKRKASLSAAGPKSNAIEEGNGAKMLEKMVSLLSLAMRRADLSRRAGRMVTASVLRGTVASPPSSRAPWPRVRDSAPKVRLTLLHPHS